MEEGIIVTPVSKDGLASDVSNYHPISLTSVVCKNMQRATVQQLLKYLHSNDFINTQQHVFLTRKSTTSNLLETINDWNLAISAQDGISAAYIDFTNAFDSVSHSKLFQKSTDMV